MQEKIPSISKMRAYSVAIPTKLWAFVCVMVCACAAADFRSNLMLTLVGFAWLAFQRKWRLLIFFVCFWFLLLALLWGITEHGLRMIIFSEFYVLLFFNLTSVFIVSWDLITTPPGELSSAFSKMHAPTSFILGLLVVFRFFPTMGTEMRNLIQSMRNRHLSGIRSFFAHPLLSCEYVLVPTLLHCLQVADQLSISAVARGAEAPGVRGSYYERKVGTLDIVWMAVWLIVSISALVVGAII